MSKYVVFATWDDAPHLTKEAKDEMWTSVPAYQREARSKGIPQLGRGAIYPISENEIMVSDFQIPPHWPRGYGMDVGWNRTAVIWAAMNPADTTLYLFSEHYRGEAEPVVHAAAIKARGEWMRGVIDPASNGRSQVDGRQLLQSYIDLGIDLETAANAVEAGILKVWTGLSTGKLKVFKSLTNWFWEYRQYHRDDKGRVVRKNNHLMDATRYLVLSGIQRMRIPLVPKTFDAKTHYVDHSHYLGTWMQ